MTITLYDPVGDVQVAAASAERLIESLTGKRVGYIFNQHSTGITFWKHLEQEVRARFNPADETKIYKDNTWRPAAQADVDTMLKKIDYALVGIGA